MTIKLTCPHCKKALGVKDHLAGKKVACPVCKGAITIPAPVALPADLEDLAAAAFEDKPAEPEPAKPTGTIDFACPNCDEPIKMSLDLAGRQAPCPACRRIVKVPLPVKKEPVDWRKSGQNKGPSLAKQNDQPAPDGAWGSATAARVSRESLLEAGAIPEAVERLPLKVKVTRGILAACAVAILGIGTWSVMGLMSQGLQSSAIDSALAAAKDTAFKPPESAAEIHRSAGEYYTRANRAEEARTQFQSARAKLVADSTGSAERDCCLIDLALSQIDLAGEKPEIEAGARIKWDEAQKDLRQTLQQVKSPEAVQLGIREVTRKLASKGQGAMAMQLAHQLSAGDHAADTLALVGVELLKAGQSTDAEKILDMVVAMVPSLQSGKPGEEASKATSNMPNLVALCALLGKQDRLVVLAPAGAEPSFAARVGMTKGLAQKGEVDSARRIAGAAGDPGVSLAAWVELAETTLDGAAPDAARSDLDAAVALLDGELRGKAASPWILYRLARALGRADMGDKAEKVAQLLQDPGLRCRAQFESLKAKLQSSTAKNDVSAAKGISQASSSYWQALGVIARTNARLEGGSAAQKDVRGWEPEQAKAFGNIGLALGMQDAGK